MPGVQTRRFVWYCLALVWHHQRWRLLLSFFLWRLPSRLLLYRLWHSKLRRALWLHLAQRFWLLRPPSTPSSRLALICFQGDDEGARNKLRPDMSVRQAPLSHLPSVWKLYSNFCIFLPLFFLCVFTAKKFFLRVRRFSSLFYFLNKLVGDKNSRHWTKTINFKPRFDISFSQIFSGLSHQEKYKTKTKDSLLS